MRFWVWSPGLWANGPSLLWRSKQHKGSFGRPLLPSLPENWLSRFPFISPSRWKLHFSIFLMASLQTLMNERALTGPVDIGAWGKRHGAWWKEDTRRKARRTSPKCLKASLKSESSSKGAVQCSPRWRCIASRRGDSPEDPQEGLAG